MLAPYPGTVEFVVGPVPSRSVTMWIAYARTVLTQATAHRAAIPALDAALIEEFEHYLDEWEAIATSEPEFIWRTDTDPERLEYLAHSFLQLVEVLDQRANERGYPISPPEGEEFYQALVSSLIAALAAEPDSSGPFSEQLRERWPGLKEP